MIGCVVLAPRLPIRKSWISLQSKRGNPAHASTQTSFRSPTNVSARSSGSAWLSITASENMTPVLMAVQDAPVPFKGRMNEFTWSTSCG